MNKYTVLVLRPDYIADDVSTCQLWVEAPGVMAAENIARREAAELDRLPGETFEDIESYAPDYAVLAVHKGHIEDLKGTP